MCVCCVYVCVYCVIVLYTYLWKFIEHTISALFYTNILFVYSKYKPVVHKTGNTKSEMCVCSRSTPTIISQNQEKYIKVAHTYTIIYGIFLSKVSFSQSLHNSNNNKITVKHFFCVNSQLQSPAYKIFFFF